MRLAIVGFGLIGRERISAIQSLICNGEEDLQLLGVCDPYTINSLPPDVPKIESIDQLVNLRPDLTIVATPHDVAFKISKHLLLQNLRVHLEKPMGRNLHEATELHELSKDSENLTIGFNYRYMEGIRQLMRDCGNGEFGDLISVSMTLGHGGSPGDRETWKLDPDQAGGGCLIDPGVHLLDLCCRIFDKIEPATCITWSGFWNTGIEEEAHVVLRSGETIININLSVVRWRSIFRIEVNGTERYGRVEGRGRTYGEQVYIRGDRWGWKSHESQKGSEELIVVDNCLDTFSKEIIDLTKPKKESSLVSTSGQALTVMTLLDQVRALNKKVEVAD